jgi:hypothetical protein
VAGKSGRRGEQRPPGWSPEDRRGIATALVLALLLLATALAGWESLLLRDTGRPRATPPATPRGATSSPSASRSPSARPTGTAPTSPSPVESGQPSPAPANDITISSVSAFARCPLPGQGQIYTDAEVEPWLAVNPTDPQNVLAVWQQDRSSTGAARAIVTGYSRDGGRAWRRVASPFGSCATGRPAGGDVYERVSDPWVSCGPTGTCYQSTLGVSQGGPSGVLISRSTDGGRSWSAAQPVAASQRSDGFNDKESVTAHPTDPNLVYVVWDRTISPGQAGTPRRGSDPPDQILLARSLDAGRTWEQPRVIARIAGTPLGNQIVVLPDGTLVNVFEVARPGESGSNGSTQQAIRSMDQGGTWSAPITIAAVRGSQVRDPATRQDVRSGEGLPDVAVDRRNGLLIVAWADTRFSNGATTDIALSMSSDGGQSWSPPRKVNQTPVAASAFTPSVEVDARGTIGVTYYDLRNNTRAAPLVTDYFLVTSQDGGATWRETRLTDRSFDLTRAPNAGGYFLGDYMGLATVADRFLAAFIVTNNSPADTTRVVFRSVP